MSTHINRRQFLGAAAAGLAASAMPCNPAHAQDQQPNIVFLLTDDQRWDAMGCAGNPIIQTPEMDRLAAGGTRFTNCFITTPICCASRASILTGQYTATHGIDDFRTPLSAEQFQRTYPAILRGAGYYTGFVGKWGIGGPLPEDAFDAFNGFSGQGLYFPDKNDPEKHLTSVIGGQAADFIESAPADRPFCLSVSFKAPHVQDQDPRQFLYDPALEDLYADDTIPVKEKMGEEYFERLPDFLKTSEGRKRWKRRFATPEMYQESVKGYYRLITGVDRAIAQVREALEEAGVADNTIIVFTSDHGFFLGEWGLAGKWLMYEESIRAPLIIHDPRRDDGGRTIDAMALNLDFAPTMLNMAGVEPPEGMEGESLLPLMNDEAVDWRDEWFFEHHFGENRDYPIPASEGVRTERYSYIRYINYDPVHEELYDIQKDPEQLHNLAGDEAHADTLELMRAKWRDWRDKLEYEE